jgi:hypothetical protein
MHFCSSANSRLTGLRVHEAWPPQEQPRAPAPWRPTLTAFTPWVPTPSAPAPGVPTLSTPAHTLPSPAPTTAPTPSAPTPITTPVPSAVIDNLPAVAPFRYPPPSIPEVGNLEDLDESELLEFMLSLQHCDVRPKNTAGPYRFSPSHNPD